MLATRNYRLSTYREWSAVDSFTRTRVGRGIAEVSRKLGAISGDDPAALLASSPDDTGVILVIEGDEVTGFSIYRRFGLDRLQGIYRALTLIAPEHQGRGLYRVIREAILPDEVLVVGPRPFYYAWRTRNPVVWFANARLCKRLVPRLGVGVTDADLVELAVQAAELLLPGQPIERPSLIMRAVYRPRCCGAEQPHPNASLDAEFRAGAGFVGSGDAVFAFGELRQKGEVGPSEEWSCRAEANR